MTQKDSKKWFFKCLAVLAALLGLTAVIVIIVDPYFHYHGPLSFLSYKLYDERYTNDGISRHFDFDALITGTSMAQNFKPSEMDALFGTNSVKEAFSGAGYQEIADNLDSPRQKSSKSACPSANPLLARTSWSYRKSAIRYSLVAYPSFPVIKVLSRIRLFTSTTR